MLRFRFFELRRLRQSLRREEILGGGGRTSDVLLVEALLEQAQIPPTARAEEIELERFCALARALQAARSGH